MGKQARSIGDEEQALRAAVREAHEAAQDLRDILREIRKQRQEWEKDANQLVNDALKNTTESLQIMRQDLEAALRGCERNVNDTTARYLGMKDWHELLEAVIVGTANDVREAVIAAISPHLPALADKAVGRFISAQIDAEVTGSQILWIEKGNGVGKIVTDPR